MLCIYDLQSFTIIVRYAGTQEEEYLEWVSKVVMIGHDADLPRRSWKDLRPALGARLLNRVARGFTSVDPSWH
jgi:hypothetical protein